MSDVLVHHPEAARRRGPADRTGIVGAVDAVDRAAEIERLGTERIAHAARYGDRQARLALAHRRGRRPRGPRCNPADAFGSRPLEPLPPDRNRIDVGALALEHVIELLALGIDDDRAAAALCAKDRQSAVLRARCLASPRPSCSADILSAHTPCAALHAAPRVRAHAARHRCERPDCRRTSRFGHATAKRLRRPAALWRQPAGRQPMS